MLSLLLLLAAADARTLLLTPFAPSTNLPPCLASGYHGVYGGEHVFLPQCSPEGIASSTATLDGGSLIPFDDSEGREIVWVGHAGVEGTTPTSDLLHHAFETLTHASREPHVLELAMEASENAWIHRVQGKRQLTKHDDAQVVFADADPADFQPVPPPVDIKLLHVSDTGMFISVPRLLLPLIDTFLHEHLVPVGVAPTPLPLEYDIPKHYAKHLADVIAKLKFDKHIAALVGSLSADAIKKDVRYLTGEDSDIVTRHSFTEGARVAADWIMSKVASTGASCEYFSYLPGFSPDVICTYPSLTNSTERVILSGHYDSRGTFGNVRAPGADDDGSGTSHVLAIAHAIGKHNLTFEKPLTLAFFSGEEQGLWGSHSYAKHLAEKNATVILQIQADMLAYRVPGEPMQLGLPETIELPEAGFLLSNLSALYAPELVVGRTAACCSDHQSFLSYGFPATQVFERAGWIADPMYHNSGDLSDREGYNFEQIKSIAKVTMAAVLEVAGYRFNGGPANVTM